MARGDRRLRWAAATLLLAPLAAPAAPGAPVFAGTARLKVERTATLEGQPHGPARLAAQALIDGCNNVRQALYGLPAAAPAEADLATLDRRTVEKLFDGERAATYVTGTALDLVDFRRWSEAARSMPTPEAPPDCAKHVLRESRSGTIWRDGRRIELRFDAKRAIARPAPQDFVPRPLLSPEQFEALPLQLQGLQGCRNVTAPALVEFVGGTACVWAAFPFAAWMNFPWALTAERRFGMPRPMHEVDRLIEAERGRAIDPAVFEVPRDFTTAGP